MGLDRERTPQVRCLLSIQGLELMLLMQEILWFWSKRKDPAWSLGNEGVWKLRLARKRKEGQRTELFNSELKEKGRSGQGGEGGAVACVSESQVEERALS